MESPEKCKHINRHGLRFYKLQEPKNGLTEVPKVGVARTSLAKDMVIPSKKNFFPEDSMDRKVKIVLRKDFNSSSSSLRVSLATTCFAQATMSGGQVLKGQDQPNFDYT